MGKRAIIVATKMLGAAPSWVRIAEVKRKKAVLTAASKEPQLRLERVSLKSKIGSHFLVKEVSFQVWTGEFVAIVGPTGAGKTTLLRLLNRLSEPTSGILYLENREYQQLEAMPDRGVANASVGLRREVTLVMQDSKLLGKSAREAIAYPLKLRGLSPGEIAARIAKWTSLLRLPEEWLDRSEMQLSGGQRQLASICRALAIEPKILLLDEPTSSLDAGRAQMVMELLKSLTTNHQLTIIMANHQLDLVQQFCDRLLYLDRGELRLDGTAAEIDWEQLRKSLAVAEAEIARDWD